MRFSHASALASALLLAGCGGAGGPPPGYAPVLPASSPAPVPRNGAIFQAETAYAPLHEGTRARRVGDVLTIVLAERTVSDKAVGGRTDRGGSLGITPPSAGPLAFLDPQALKAAATASFKGGGEASQRSTLSGAIAVTVAEVRPNGTALVVGEKQMLLSQGDEWVQFAGIVRLADIDGDNQVPSTRVADARMVHSGTGAVQRASRPGWLSRFFGQISPF